MENPLKPIISTKELHSLSTTAKSSILAMTTLAGSGHPGGSLSSLDLLLALYHCIDIDPENPLKRDRDRVVISHGHISPAVYSVLALRGFFDLYDAIIQFRLAGSPFEGHIESGVPGVEWDTGNLGQGLSAACGFALECQLKFISNHIYCFMGDGEQQKGQLSEARRFAVKYKLNNITAIVDYNRLQISGRISDVMPQNIKACYEADGWAVIQINGHDYDEIFDALNKARAINAPVLILARTIMGNGVSFMENKEKYHGAALNYDELAFAFKELDYALTEQEFKENGELHRKKREMVKADKAWSKFEIRHRINLDFKTNDEKVYEKATDNRTAWGDAIAEIAALNKGSHSKLAVFDCDLMGSVKTNAFKEIMPTNFFQAGIAEHHTAVCAGALSKYGIQTFFAGFGMFGLTEVYNQHRLNDINKTNLKVILTHVGLDVGEDGKTHQCIDYIGLVNNMFDFKLIIPADANQTYKAINFLANKEGNWLVAMGRSKHDIIRNENDEIYFGKNYVFEYGKADVLRKGSQGTLFVTGTLVSTAIKVGQKLSEEDIDIRLINVSSPLHIDAEVVADAIETGIIFTLEDHNVKTGLGSLIAQKMVEMIATHKLTPCTMVNFGVSEYACSGSADDVYKYMGLDVDNLVEKVRESIWNKA